MDNLFAKATRTKVRFTTKQGQISVEDLWDLSLQRLDEIAVALDQKLKTTSPTSFIGNTKPTKDQAMMEMQLEVVKHVITTKMSEAAASKDRTERNQQIDNLQSILYQKKHQELLNLSAEDLEKKIKELESQG